MASYPSNVTEALEAYHSACAEHKVAKTAAAAKAKRVKACEKKLVDAMVEGQLETVQHMDFEPVTRTRTLRSGKSAIA